MAWIESHQELADHPKTKRLMRALGVDRYTVIGVLHVLWYWALDYADDGNLSAFSDADIADGVGWPGDASELVHGLTVAGFLDETRTIHDWDDFAGRYVAKRQANAERMRVARAAEPPHLNGTRAEHVQRTSDARAMAVQECTGATVPNSTGEERNLTGEEPETGGALAANAAPPKSVPKPNRTTQVIDLLAAEGVEVNPRPQDGKAIKNSGARPEEIAAVYLAIYRGEFGDDFMLQQLSLQSAIDHLDGYRASQAKSRAAPSSSSRHSNDSRNPRDYFAAATRR